MLGLIGCVSSCPCLSLCGYACQVSPNLQILIGNDLKSKSDSEIMLQ